jgi:hypothetical protein
MHIQYWKKNISILAKATQVSDVAHGPLVQIIVPGGQEGHNRELNHIYMCLYRKKKSFPEPAGQYQSNLHINGINHPCVKEILSCSNKGHVVFKGELITKLQTWDVVI